MRLAHGCVRVRSHAPSAGWFTDAPRPARPSKVLGAEVLKVQAVTALRPCAMASFASKRLAQESFKPNRGVGRELGIHLQERAAFKKDHPFGFYAKCAQSLASDLRTCWFLQVCAE